MKRVLVVLVTSLWLAVIPAAAAQNPQDELIRLEKQWAAAGPKGDVGFFERIATDDYVMVDSDGRVRDKQQELAEFRSEKLETSTVNDLKVRVYGNSAVVVGRYSITGREKGEPFRISGTFTDMWVKRNGGWRLVSTQNSNSGEACPNEKKQAAISIGGRHAAVFLEPL